MPKRAGANRKSKPKQSQDNLLVRNSYSLPKGELAELTELVDKLRFNKKIDPQMKKSEIVRVGLWLAGHAKVGQLLRIRKQLGILNVGRPAKKETVD